MSSANILNEHPPGGNNHRRSSRQRIEALAYVDLGPGNGGFPINVSEGGMTFQGIQPLEKDQLLRIRFKLPGNGTSLEATAKVTWLNGLGKGGGLQFIELPENTQRQINQWLSSRESPCGLVENAAISSSPVEAKIIPSFPASHLVAGENATSENFDPKAAEPLSDSWLSSLPATGDPPTTILMTPSRDSKDSARIGNKRLRLGLIMAVAVVAVPGMISLGLRRGSQPPIVPVFFAQPVTKSETSTQREARAQRAAVSSPISDPAVSESAATLITAPAIGTGGPTEVAATPKLTVPVSRPAKKAGLSEINPTRTASGQTEVVANALKQRPNVTTPAPRIPSATPTLAVAPEPSPKLATPPLASPAPELVQKNGKIDAAQLIARKNPVFPAAARAAGVFGSVQLHFIIGADGNVRDVNVVEGNPLLAGAAVQAVQMWHYQPARRDGIPVDTESKAAFEFKRTLSGGDQEFLYVTSE